MKLTPDRQQPTVVFFVGLHVPGMYVLVSDRDRFWPNRTEPRFSRQQYGRTEIYRDFLGANMAEPRFTEIAKYAAEPNRTEIAENY